MNCQNCNSTRVLMVGAKCSDMCNVELRGVEHDGYVPDDLGIGGGDYIEMEVCLDCGTVQGNWPADRSPLLEPNNDDD